MPELKNTLYIFLFDGRKRCTSCPKEGEGGGRGNSGNARKKTFFFQEVFPYVCLLNSGLTGPRLQWFYMCFTEILPAVYGDYICKELCLFLVGPVGVRQTHLVCGTSRGSVANIYSQISSSVYISIHLCTEMYSQVQCFMIFSSEFFFFTSCVFFTIK